MGLDNGFELRSKKNPYLIINLEQFRKYYELNTWCMGNCNHIEDYLVTISKNDVKNLKQEVEPVALELLKIEQSKLLYYDENGYPKKYEMSFYGNNFSPICTETYLPGTKLCKLYFSLLSIESILNSNEDDIYITFYSSF